MIWLSTVPICDFVARNVIRMVSLRTNIWAHPILLVDTNYTILLKDTGHLYAATAYRPKSPLYWLESLRKSFRKFSKRPPITMSSPKQAPEHRDHDGNPES